MSQPPTMSDAHRESQKKLFDNLWGFFTTVVELESSKRLTLLDFGAGAFGYVNHYCRHFGRCYALDIYDYSQLYEPPIEFLVSNGRDIPLPDHSVDAIVAHSVLEHVEDIDYTLAEMDRVLRNRGYVFLTVSPLYYSYCGGHLYAPHRLDNWEHLDPTSPHFITEESATKPLRGSQLNGLTNARFLSAVGKQPWEILRFALRAQYEKQLPAFLKPTDINYTDLFVREFRFIGRKLFSVVDGLITFK